MSEELEELTPDELDSISGGSHSRDGSNALACLAADPEVVVEP